jgi:chemotaxis protein CheX
MAALVLGEVLDLNAATPLKAAFLERRGAAVEVDASGVRRLGGLCLQVLLAAKAAWSADGQAFSVTNASESFLEALRLFGAQTALQPASHGA